MLTLKLDDECWRCYGSGTTFEDWKNSTGAIVRCDSCNGIGRTLTEAGREIVELVKAHLLTPVSDERTQG